MQGAAAKKSLSQAERRARTRKALLDAATMAIGEKGFDAVSLDEIAAGAGLTKGAIYDHFGSKDGLFRAVVAEEAAPIPFPLEKKAATADERMADLARRVMAEGERTRLRLPIQAAFLLYSLSHPELQANAGQRICDSVEFETARLLEAFSPEELPMAPERFVVMLQAMIPGLMYIRSQAPDLVTDEAVGEIFAGLVARKGD